MGKTFYKASHSAAQFVKRGYGQVEPNHLSAQHTGQIYAQLPAAAAIEKPSDKVNNNEFISLHTPCMYVSIVPSPFTIRAKMIKPNRISNCSTSSTGNIFKKGLKVDKLKLKIFFIEKWMYSFCKISAIKAIKKHTNWPIIVASAAPIIPYALKPSLPLIKQ